MFVRVPLILLALCLAQTEAQAQPPAVPGVPTALATLRYIDVVQGTGAPAAAGKRFTVHYTGWLKDGTKFDSSVDRNEPFDFIQGRRQVIAGWDLGFEGMKVGGKRRLFVPYQLAYGETGSGPIPAKADLIFDVELLNVEDVPGVIPAIDVLQPFADLEARVIALARIVPEEKYSWRPNASSRTFAQVLLRIADSAKLLDSVASGDIKTADLAPRLLENDQTPPPGKYAILVQLTNNLAEVHKDMEGVRNGFLAGNAELFGKVTTNRGLLTRIDTAIAEQLGQAIAYAHMNGIALPWNAAELQ
ncbi:MAG TPA: FKBP-type peptidyl-prolyl cis-trans isomerase [Bryobacteraceae bacterium]|nr:FKBP-type peptidyl-prolyl cis-trans isomerase [Bryobacteraceae bacterium]